jgi:putative transposase
MSTTKDWPHAPVHRIDSAGIYMVTGATIHKDRIFNTAEKLRLVENELLTLAQSYEWQLEAWAVFSNHYHFVGRSHSEEASLKKFVHHLHSNTSRKINYLDDSAGRRFWYNFWDKKLTFERSYFARLNYVHQNPVKHGLVLVANQYPWCSASWFERIAPLAMVKTIYSFQVDKLKIDDDY